MQFGGTVLYVNDDSATVEFYREAFGLALRFFDTELGFAELDTGGSMLAIASHSLAERLTPGRYVDRLLGTATDAAGYEVTILAHYPPYPSPRHPGKAPLAGGASRTVDRRQGQLWKGGA
jgi:hypothetical protein